MSEAQVIPEDIRRTASFYVGMMFAGVTLGTDVDKAAKIYGDAQKVMREALAEERERCAKIAEAMDTDGRSNWGAFTARNIRSSDKTGT